MISFLYTLEKSHFGSIISIVSMNIVHVYQCGMYSHIHVTPPLPSPLPSPPPPPPPPPVSIELVGDTSQLAKITSSSIKKLKLQRGLPPVSHHAVTEREGWEVVF